MNRTLQPQNSKRPDFKSIFTISRTVDVRLLLDICNPGISHLKIQTSNHLTIPFKGASLLSIACAPAFG